MIENYKIEIVSTTTSPEIASFLMKHHYIKSLPRGCKNIILLRQDGNLVGIAAFGCPVGNRVKATYGVDLELKRFCLAPHLPKNSGSWFMSKAMVILKAKGYKSVISYADPEYGHEGVLYRASNFTYLGKQKYKTPYFIIDNKKVYSRNVYSGKHLNTVKNRRAKVQWAQPKHIYRYQIQ